MAEPLVSVLMPVYQAEATLRQTLECLRSQTLDRFEIVAVDDGSTDATVQQILDSQKRLHGEDSLAKVM